MENGDSLLTVKEVAKLTRLSIHTVRQYIVRNVFSVTRLGHRTFVKKSVILAWIEDNTGTGNRN